MIFGLSLSRKKKTIRDRRRVWAAANHFSCLLTFGSCDFRNWSHGGTSSKMVETVRQVTHEGGQATQNKGGSHQFKLHGSDGTNWNVVNPMCKCLICTHIVEPATESGCVFLVPPHCIGQLEADIRPNKASSQRESFWHTRVELLQPTSTLAGFIGQAVLSDGAAQPV